MKYLLDVDRLKSWFSIVKRDLPWRHVSDPYAIWVSEIMLQQTQVSVVVPYFLRWMQRFPTIQSLAEASLDEVIKLWEGLGYYSRARHLHAGAQYVWKELAGNLPQEANELAKIKGLGPYTIGAIRSFAFQQKAAAVDGNVLRVLSRYFYIQDDIGKPTTIKKMWKIAEAILPDNEPWMVNEALIELGAMVCKRQPLCTQCPLVGSCQGYVQDATNRLPVKSKKTIVEVIYRVVPVIQHQDYFLMMRGGTGKIMEDLHEFPYFDTDNRGIRPQALIKKIYNEWKLKVVLEGLLPLVTHSFTRYRVHLQPFLLSTSTALSIDKLQWIKTDRLQQLALSSGHRRVLEAVLKLQSGSFDATQISGLN